MEGVNRRAEEMREELREQREYVIERLELVIQAMGWDVEGFGGLGTINNDSLMSTLEMAWQAPHGRQMIQATVPPRERTATATRIQEIIQDWHDDRRIGPDPVPSFSRCCCLPALMFAQLILPFLMALMMALTEPRDRPDFRCRSALIK